MQNFANEICVTSIPDSLPTTAYNMSHKETLNTNNKRKKEERSSLLLFDFTFPYYFELTVQ